MNSAWHLAGSINLSSLPHFSPSLSLTPIYPKTVEVGEIMLLFFLNVLIPSVQRLLKNMSWRCCSFSTQGIRARIASPVI